MRATVILTTAPNLRQARALAKLLVAKRLAACVSMKPGWLSFYRWKGKIETAKEVLILIKTKERQFNKIETVIRQNHSYEIPEIIALPVRKGSKEYLSWLKKSVR